MKSLDRHIELLKNDSWNIYKKFQEKDIEIEQLQNRIDKAIEELEMWQPKEKILQEEKEYLLDIIKGDDKE